VSYSKSSIALFGFLFATTAFAADPKAALSQLSDAIGRGDKKLFQTILPKITDVNQPFNPQKETALTLAAYNDHYEWVEVLIRRGANIDHQTSTGYSALMFASMGMRNADDAVKTVQLLLASGANRDLKNRDGKTALDLARERNQTKIIALF